MAPSPYASGLLSWLILLVALAGGWRCAPVAEEAPARPNVVVLFTDDQRYDTIHALGNDAIVTPNLDRLAAMGTAFTRAHVMGGHHGAICAPSRAMLMTGRTLFALQETGDVIPDAHVMMPEAFARAGYVTFGTGKWHNNRDAYARAFQAGGPIFFGGMHWPDQGGHEAPRVHDFNPAGDYPDSTRRQVETFSSTLFADAAVNFLNRQRGSEQPFFAYVAFSSPHDPRTPPEAFRRLYAPERLELPPNVLPEHPFDNGELTVRDELLLPHPRTPEAVRGELAAYYGMISEVDAQIGRILDALAANGQLDHTIIVFAGDNGLAVGSHGLLGKQNLYEHSTGVPLILAGPGVPRGATRDALVYLADIFPTVADLAGVPTPETVLTPSMAPVLQNPDAPTRDVLFTAYRDLQRAVRTADDWKLITYHVNGTHRTQLFHLSDDPYEMHDLSGDPAYADRRTALEALLTRQQAAYGDPLANDE